MARRVSRKPGQRLAGAKALLLFVLPLPLFGVFIVALTKGLFLPVVTAAGALFLYLAGAALARRALMREAQYERRKYAPAALPLKLIAAVLIAGATFVTAWLGARHNVLIALCFGAGVLLGFYLVYGFDHRVARMPTGFGMSPDEVAAAIDEAENDIERIEQAGYDIRNTELRSRLQRICRKAREILTVIEEDPRDLRRARKFLKVYLDGAKQVSEGYARAHKRDQHKELEQNFRNVLVTIEEVFAEQHQKLLENDILDLDVQMEVLSAQLKREGVI
ncbi:MAG: 5-bromo-4-chloroindolyl phosphate hydrolysis family protein [Gammaproteobacteria bacterium]